MRRRYACFVIAAVAACGSVAGAAGEEEPITLRCQVFRVIGSLAGETAMDDPFWAGEEPPDAELKKAITFFESAQFRLGTDRFTIDDNDWRWNGEAFDHGDLSIALPESRIQLIAHPSVEVHSGGGAEVDIQSRQKIEYFEKVESDLFRLKRLETPTGLRIDTRVVREKDGRFHLPDLTFSLQLVERREPIPGLSLRVGRPVLQNREYKTPVRLVGGRDYGVLLSPGKGQGVLIIRMRVESNSEHN